MLLTLVVFIALQNPSPGRGIVGQNKQYQTERTHQPSEADQRGTQDSPIFVEQVPTPKTQEETTQEAKDRNQKATNDGNLVTFTGRLVTATYALGVMAFFQLVVFGYQAAQLRQTVETAADQSKAIIASERAWAQATLDFVPGMRVVYETVSDNGIESQSGSFRLFYQNIGKTPAWITRIHACLQVVDVLPEPPDLSVLELINFVSEVLPANLGATSCDFPLGHDINLPKTGHHRMTIVWGVIEYRDIFEKPRRTYFGYSVGPDRSSLRRLISRSYNRHE